ncbi:MAG: class I SAM-dependent methyltransferase [Chitinophagaceae bacterium]|nr:MAG: class I SAM-dependent methyltransferase [Chitinophagaceae bacterium]
MDESLKTYFQLVFEDYSNDDLLLQLHNPLREYDNELIDGTIVDVGCGQSAVLLDYATTKRKLIGIDSEQFQLDFLKKRVALEPEATLQNWSFLKQEFPRNGLPKEDYAAVIFSDLLHFFTIEECAHIAHLVTNCTKTGCIIFVKVHSYRHPGYNEISDENNDYFKHFFTVADLDRVFTDEFYERIYSAEIEKLPSKEERNLQEKWIKRLYKAVGVTDKKLIEEEVNRQRANDREAQIIALFRRK